jgi:hypothetical protein
MSAACEERGRDCGELPERGLKVSKTRVVIGDERGADLGESEAHEDAACGNLPKSQLEKRMFHVEHSCGLRLIFLANRRRLSPEAA